MKKIFIAIVFITTQLSIYAQEPMGGGDFGGGRPPMGSFNPMDGENDEATEVLKFPEIPGLTDKQREKVISEVVKERDAVVKLDQQKRALFAKRAGNGAAPRDKRPDLPQMEERPLPPALSDADKKKMDKIDLKIQKVHSDTDRKCRMVLSQEQYLAFKEKKKEIMFNNPNKGADKSNKAHRMQGGNPPDMPMGGGGDF